MTVKDLVCEGEPIEEEVLLNILQQAKEEIKDGKLFTMDEVRAQIKSWKKK